MKEWRLRGFVQDSDDEYAECGIETQPREDVDGGDALTGDGRKPGADEVVGNASHVAQESELNCVAKEVAESFEPGGRMQSCGNVDDDDVDELQMDQIAPKMSNTVENSRMQTTTRERPVWRAPPVLNLSRSNLEPSKPVRSNIQRSESEGRSSTTLHASETNVIVENERTELEAALTESPLRRSDVQVIIQARQRHMEGNADLEGEYNVHAMASGSEILEEPSDQADKQPEVHVPLFPDDDQEHDRATRNLRQRKAIQLHPYGIEQQQYRQTMKSRGVKPVRLPTDSRPEEEQDDLTHVEPIRARSHSPNLRRNHNRQRSETMVSASPFTPVGRAGPVHLAPFILGDDEDLPDLSALFRKRRTPEAQQGSIKRRKVRTYSARFVGERSPPTGPRNFALRSPVEDDMETFDVPTSPSSTSALPSPLPHKHNTTSFRFPPGFSTQHLPTPETSSSARNGIEPEFEELDESDIDIHSVDSMPGTIHFADDGSPEAETVLSGSDSGSSQEIRGIQKRIKGVLPASWLKLDLQKRTGVSKTKATSPRRTQLRRDEDDLHRGVAKRRIGTLTRRSKSPLSPVPIVLSDQSDSESDLETLPFGTLPLNVGSVQTTNQPWRSLLGNPSLRLDDDPGDQMEDNAIDHMGPSTSRPHHRTRTGRKRQTILKDSFGNASKRVKNGHSSSIHRTPTSKNTNSRRGSGPAHLARKRKNAPRLSIMDVLEDKATTPAAVPQFLRIAARQARRVPEHGRQSPTNKQIRLQTRQDTEDANSVLGDWRSGRILQRSLPQKSKEERPPLAERTSNLQTEQAATLRHSSLSTKPREPVQSISNLRQTRLQPVILQKSSEAKSRHQAREKRKALTSLKASKRPQSAYHPAQLEAEESEMDIPNDRLRFQQHLRNVDRDFDALRVHVAHRNPRLDAFINEGFPPSSVPELPSLFVKAKPRNPVPVTSNQKQATLNTLPIRRRIRKRPPRRVDIDAREFRQPDGLILSEPHRSASVEAVTVSDSILRDLGPIGTHFTVDFDVFPLPTGTYFHSTTFVGSGEFHRSLFMDHRNLDVDAGRHITDLCGRTCSWSRWDDEMATTVQEVFTAVGLKLETHGDLEDSTSPFHGPLSELVSLFRQVIKLNSGFLSFFDPVDRSSCVSKFMDTLEPIQIALVGKLDSSSSQALLKPSTRLLVRAAVLQLALARQLLAIAHHQTVSTVLQSRTQTMIKDLSSTIGQYLVRRGFEDIGTFYDEDQRHAIREAGIRDDRLAVEACLILWHVLDASKIQGHSFWSSFNREVASEADNCNKVGTLDQKWHQLFTILPLLEVNPSGVLQIGNRFQEPHDSWGYVKPLLSRVFSLYKETARTPGSNINNYVRTLLLRCHHLIRGWGWRGCELIIGVIFDFFACNGLAPLRHEDVRGSPRFLESLHQHPSMDPLPEDNSFHTFLKILGTGLQGMRGFYIDRKIQSIAWRCIPNHGRKYLKDQDLMENDLAALRNHHDLLCTLYWACPPGCRLRVDTIANLVDHTTSHREACRLNIKSWTNLVKFQLSTGESVEKLEPFTSWFRDIVEQTINQFKAARSEAEAQYEKLKKNGVALPSADALKRNIARNQNQVLASLVDAIAGMKFAVESTDDHTALAELLRNSTIERVFGLFDAKKVRTNGALIEVLHVYSAFLDKCMRATSKPDSQPVSDESQDYGEWPDMEQEPEPHEQIPNPIPTDFIFEPLSQFLSDCFGADTIPDDTLLTTLVDTWFKTGACAVQTGAKDWVSFLDNFSPHSWNQLRDTEQTRKYGPYFLSLTIEHDRSVLHGNDALFMSAWLVALVEREARLKFQHRLTTAILKAKPQDALLCNLPFIASSRTGVIDISATELRERRLALLSSVLSNIRDHFNEILLYKPQATRETRQEYSSYLKLLMAAMKKNYLELRQGDTVTGTYVAFVQSIVEFLQQYTSDICPVDSFFTDSSVFPLPAKDPTYVVGRLKGYGAKLGDIKVVKQLASFVQNVSKRAAMDNEQLYLVEQLQAAMSKIFESGKLTHPTLRTLLIQGIFPSYIEASLSTTTGWIIATPILQSCTQMFEEFIYDFSVTDEGSLETALQNVSTMLWTLQCTISDLSLHPEALQHPRVLHIVTMIFRATAALMPSLDYILRRTGRGRKTAQCIKYTKNFSIFVAKTIMGHDDAVPPLDIQQEPRNPAFIEIRSFCKKELERDLAKNWSRDGEGYHVFVQGSGRKEVLDSLGTVEEERDSAVAAIEEFFTVLDMMEALR
jgi:hypothetical protein